jgi:tetratricopeptide (TPR) repeat protein
MLKTSVSAEAASHELRVVGFCCAVFGIMHGIMSVHVRLFCFFLLIWCAGCGALAQKHVQTFQEAQSAFEAGEFQQAVTLYLRLIDQNVKNGAVYYNLGNAWARADQPDKAVAAYYLAKRYSPNDPHLEANLRTLLINNGGTISSAGSLISSIFFWQDSVGCQTKLWTSTVLAVLTFFCGTARLFWKNRMVTNSFFCLLFFTLTAVASAGYDWYRYEYLDQMIVAVNGAVPRKGNSEQYEPAFVSPIPFGTPVIFLDERGDWCCLRFPNGQEGWLPLSQTLRLQ